MIFDLTQVPTFDGHITVNAFNCLCGYNYVYYGILNRREKIMFPRAKNTYLKYIPLKDVDCIICKNLKLKLLNEKYNH